MSDEAKKPEKVDLRELEVQAMRLKAVSMAPYLSTALWSMHPVCRPGLRGGDKGGMAVDKYWRLYYDPTVFDVWTIDECAAVLLHEVWHLLRDHVGRAGKMGLTPEDYSIESQAKHKVWNLAADCEINDDLREEKTGLPEGLLYPDDSFGFENNLMAEIYFDLLWKDLKDDVKARQKMIDDGTIFGGPNGQDGSGATGQISRWEVGSSKGKNGKDGDADLPEGVPVGESELLRKQVAQEISKQAGAAEGFASRWAGEQWTPPSEWRPVRAGSGPPVAAGKGRGVSSRRTAGANRGSPLLSSHRSRRPPWMSWAVQTAPCSWTATAMRRKSGITVSSEPFNWP